jgi:hypothetical protein
MLKIDRGLDVAKEHGVERSPLWEKVERDFKSKNPKCACCGSTKDIQVHHINPFHDVVLAGFPELELDERNLISLCEENGKDHHLLLGHGGSFRNANLNVIEDCIYFLNKSENLIKADVHYNQIESSRMKTWNDMTDTEKEQFKKHLIENFLKKDK